MGRGDRKDYDDLANSFGNLRENCVRQRSNLAPTPGNVKNICVGLIISIIEYILPCPFTYKEHKIALYREKKTPKSLWGRLRTKGTLENSLLVCFIGWTVGVGLSYLWFESRISQYPELRRVLTWNAAILGLVLSTLIGFTRKGRCLAVLCIPNLTSNAIKTWLLAYIIALVIGGPILNCSNNIKRGGQSLACIKKVTGEELNNAQQKVSRPTGQFASQLVEICKQLSSISIRSQTLEKAFAEILQQMRRFRDKIFKTYKKATEFCQKDQVYSVCMKSISAVIKGCFKEVAWYYKPLCPLTVILYTLCPYTIAIKQFCGASSIFSKFLEEYIKDPFRKVKEKTVRMFWFHITMEYHYSYTFTSDKQMIVIADLVRASLSKYFEWFFLVLDMFPKFFGMLTIIVLFISSIKYYEMYTRLDFYDQKFITFFVLDVDERQRQISSSVEPLLPLQYSEGKRYYSSIFSPRVKWSEFFSRLIGLVQIIIVLIFSSFCLLLDVFIYEAYQMIYYSLEKDNEFEDFIKNQGKEELSLQVEGEGAIAGIYKRLTQYPATADTPSEFWDQVTKCISEPVEPDYENAKTILFLHLVVFILVFYALYFLRFRHLICDYFYPERAQKRAVWLYNKIIRSRVWGNSGLITSAKMGSGAGSQVKRKVTCKQRCMACCPGKCDFLWKFLNWRGQTCSICGVEGPLDDQEKFFKCDNKECALVYCVDCVTAFKNNCKGCGQYIIFDTDSDMDYEEDSTDEREKLSKIKGEDMTQSQAENAIIYRWGYDELLNRGREARDLTSKFKEESETDIEGNLAENHINKRKNKQPKATKSIFKGMTAERQYGKEEYGLTPEIVAFCQEKGLDPEYIDVLIEEYEALGIYDRWLQRGGFRSKLKWAKRTVTGEKPTDISLDELNNRLMNRVMDTTKQIKILEVYTDAVRREEEDKNKRNH